MTDRLSHRGPDGRGFFVDASRKAGLGHRRLSIIDVEGGQQPLWNEDRSICAVVAGELYDFEAIRSELVSRGHRFATGSDSEIAVHLYEELGLRFVERLRGEFSICLWDQRKEELVVVRDRFGVKPVFYASHNGDLVVASEIKALLAAGVPARWDHKALLSQLLLCLPQGSSLFDGVRQLEPGCLLRASARGVTTIRYWDLDYPRIEDAPTAVDAETIFGRLREALDDAVRVRLRSDVPYGFFLSGGLDSSGVIGLARQHMSDPPQAFTVCFDGDSQMNEVDEAQATARYVGADFHPTPINESDLAGSFEAAVEFGEMVALNGHAVARFIHSKVVRDAGCKVALSGSGADDLLGGYPALRQDLLEFSGCSRYSAESPAVLGDVRRLLGFSPSWMRKLAIDRSLFFLLLGDQLLDEFDRRNPYTDFVESSRIAEQLQGRHPVLQSAYLWDAAFLGNYELMAERLEMACGLEVRLPYLDQKVFEVARSIPPELLLRGNQEKYVLRRAIRPFIADRIYRRRKHSFTAPLSLVDRRSELFTLFQDNIRSSYFARQDLFRPHAVIDFVERIDALPDKAKVAADCVMTILLSVSLLGSTFGVS